VDTFHSVLHMLLNMVPSSMDRGASGKGSNSGQAGEATGEEEDISDIMMQHGDSGFMF